MYSYYKYALISDTAALSGSSYITDFNYNIPLMVSITSSFEKILQLVRRTYTIVSVYGTIMITFRVEN